jgi:hypothetical protein
MSNLLKYAKGLVAVLAPTYLLFKGYQTDGMTASEWWDVATSALIALGVIAVPNRQGDTARRAEHRNHAHVRVFDQDAETGEEPRHGGYLQP